MNVLRGFRADLQARVLRLHHAIVNVDVIAGPKIGGLARGFDHDGIVAADNVTIADFHVTAMVGVDPVAIGDIELIADLDSIDEHGPTANQVQAPAWGLAKGDVGDAQVAAGGELKQPGPPALGPPPFPDRVEAGHELRGAAIDRAGAGGD